MGCGDAFPFVPGLKRDDWPLEDPKGKPVERVREIREDVNDDDDFVFGSAGERGPIPYGTASASLAVHMKCNCTSRSLARSRDLIVRAS